MPHRKRCAWMLLFVMALDTIAPAVSFALTSGPTQPEVQGFSPIGATDMVNLFSGDMSYNIPLLDVEGYPINLSYSAGAGMDQEASWVGLGWSLNPGVVERHLRGLPDDFRGDVVRRETSMRPNITVGATVGVSAELFGLDLDALGADLTVSANPSYNNYDGVQFSIGANFGMKSTLGGGSTFTAGLGLNSSSHSGLSLQPTIGVERQVGSVDKKLRGGLNFGLSMNSRQGLTNVTLGTSLKSTETATKKGSGKSYTKTNWSRSGPMKSFDIGQPTYTPQLSVPMENLAISLRVTLGTDAVGVHPHGFIGGSYSRQRVRNNLVSQPAFGYLHLGAGQDQVRALMDFNREKDGPYMPGHAGLPIAQLTNDVFAVSGQNIGGSYRAYRDEVGHVFDGLAVSTGSGGNLGVEIGVGAGAHFGVDLNVNSAETRSGNWLDGNAAGSRLRFKRNHDHPLEEHAYFREANEPVLEQDASLYASLGENNPKRFSFSPQGGFDMRLNASLVGPGPNPAFPASNEKSARDPRGQLFSYLTHRDVERGMGLVAPVARPGGPFDLNQASPIPIPGHHISEITVLGANGSRNIYGLPAYNITQKDVTFSVSTSASADALLTTYTHGVDNSTGNTKGKDRFFSASYTPPYAHSWLLSAVVSPDYSDVDGVPGPSENDLGTYTRFSYALVDPAFPWRTPVSPSSSAQARLDRGLGAVTHDDKASYSYGTKEVWYLERIESRNMVAIFKLRAAPRQDGLGVNEDGTKNLSHVPKALDRIELWEKSQVGIGDPIKVVHFEYDQSLCAGNLPNAVNGSVGKLTLKKVWFTYGRSHRGVTSPYKFTYANTSQGYNLDATDRWGVYKPPGAIPNQDFPYAEQRPIVANTNASAWNLVRISLPSGGTIRVSYESDDYAYVQTKRAHRMFMLAGMQPLTAGGNDTDPADADLSPTSLGLAGVSEGRRLFFRIPQEYAAACSANDSAVAEAMSRDLGGLVYYRFLTTFDFGVDEGDEYVSGYLAPSGNIGVVQISGSWFGYFTVMPVNIDVECVGGCASVLPMFRSALEMARTRYSTEVFRPNGIGGDDSPVLDMIMAASSSIIGLFTGLAEFLQGPNAKARSEVGNGFGEVDVARSWLRLAEPSGHKRGGGHRVAEVMLSDSWGSMVDAGMNPLPSRSYGQNYTYTLEDGTSSGVAAWEPNIGADENVWRRPVYGVNPASMGNDDRIYQEEPFGESMFPSASVGYSRVVVRDIYPDAAAQAAQGTGYVVNLFHTARDFPTFAAKTDLHARRRRSNYDVLALLGLRANDHMHTTQGYVVETNDMHGKPYRTEVYGEPSAGVPAPLVSWVQYNYAREPGNPSRLVNHATTISPNGSIGQHAIGRHYEFFADMREYNSKSRSGGMAVNTEYTPPFILIPIMLFQFSMESTIYRSGVFVKKVHRFGLLESMEKMENGSVVSTDNLAYDSETGGVLLTRTRNEFEDPVYQLKFPAYWHYDGMGPAYRNIGALVRNLSFSNGTATYASAASVFVPGDELIMDPVNAGNAVKGWVTSTSQGILRVIDRLGNPLAGNYDVRVMRSGRRNQQEVDMATLATLSDPLAGFSGNVFSNIVQASAVEMDDAWRTSCECLEDATIPFTSNPYLMNMKGVWRMTKENAWLTDRMRSLLNSNTDIRRDGVFTTFDPFYELAAGAWVKAPHGWTMVREVTNYSVRGQELENLDALGIPSSATFGYGGMLAKSVARNAYYREAGFDNFEDRNGPYDCADRHFRVSGGASIVNGIYHSGRRSIRVTQSQPGIFESSVSDCVPVTCTLQAAWNGSAILLSGGEAPYALNPIVMQGAPIITLVPGGLQVAGSGWTIQLTATDASGCALSQSFSN